MLQSHGPSSSDILIGAVICVVVALLALYVFAVICYRGWVL